MTKEQILEKQKPNIKYPIYYHESNVLDAMEEYAQQQLSAERERAGKLVEALKFAFDEFEDLNLHRQAARIHETLNELKSRL